MSRGWAISKRIHSTMKDGTFFHSSNTNGHMAQYDFYQDQKYTIWERIHFTIEARSEEEAAAKATSAIRSDIYFTEEESVRVVDTEILFDTVEEISIEDNAGNATKEIYMVAPHQDKMPVDNTDEVIATAS